MCIDFEEILVGIIMHTIAQIYKRVIALDLSKYFVFAHFLQNEWMEFNKGLYTLRYWQDLGWDCFDKLYNKCRHINTLQY